MSPINGIGVFFSLLLIIIVVSMGGLLLGEYIHNQAEIIDQHQTINSLNEEIEQLKAANVQLSDQMTEMSKKYNDVLILNNQYQFQIDELTQEIENMRKDMSSSVSLLPNTSVVKGGTSQIRSKKSPKPGETVQLEQAGSCSFPSWAIILIFLVNMTFAVIVIAAWRRSRPMVAYSNVSLGRYTIKMNENMYIEFSEYLRRKK